MRFSELFRTDKRDNTKRLADLGAISFGKGVTDKNEPRTPHYEIDNCLKMLENNPIVSPAIEQLVQFIVPNRDVKIASSCEKSRKFLEQWHNDRKDFLHCVRDILTTNLACGNGPMEKHYTKTTDGRIVLDDIYAENDMKRIYVNPDNNDEEAYYFELPLGIKQFKYMGKIQTPANHDVRYVKDYSWTMKRIWSIPIPAQKLKIFKSGWSRDNIYGRSVLASAIDANNIFNDILSSWDTIARTRQVDQKILTVDNKDGIEVPQNRLDKLAEDLEDADKSYTLFNVPLKLLQQDINTSNNYDTMEGVVDTLRRMVMLSLLPQHLTPWSDSATTMGSDSAMPSFLGRIKAKQNQLNEFLTDNVIGELRKTYPWLHEDACYVFDEPKVMSDEGYIRNIENLIRMGILKPKEAKTYLKKLGIIDEDILDSDDSETMESVKVSESFKEINQAVDVGFETWKKRLTNRDPNIKTTGWKELKNTNIGGKVTRLIFVNDKNGKGKIIIFDGLRLIDTFDLDNTRRKTVDDAYADYNKQLRDMQEEFEDEKTDEDLIIEDAEKQMKKLIEDKLQNLFKLIDSGKVKNDQLSEAFLSTNILGKIGNAFSGFARSMNSIVANTMNKLGLEVESGEDDSMETPNDIKTILKKSKSLMQRNIQAQIQDTKDSMLNDIKKAVTDGIAVGKSHANIKSDLRDRFNYKDGIGYKFDRLLNTELRNSTTLMKLKKWKAMGFETFVWITRDDGKVRDSHRAKHQRVFNIDDALKSRSDDYEAYPGKSARCRCRAQPYS